MQLKFHHLFFPWLMVFFQIWVAISTNAMSIVNSHIRQFKIIIICCWWLFSFCFIIFKYIFQKKGKLIWFKKFMNCFWYRRGRERERDIQRTIQKKVYFGIYIYIVKFNFKKVKVRSKERYTWNRRKTFWISNTTILK